MNKTQFIGNVVRDCENRVTPSGVEVCSFTVAVNGKRKEDETIFYRVTAWRKLAEICGKYVKKGTKIYICGTIEKPNVYQTKNGEYRCDLCITADDMELLSRANDHADSDDDNSSSSMPEPEPKATQSGGYTDVTNSLEDDDSLPF